MMISMRHFDASPLRWFFATIRHFRRIISRFRRYLPLLAYALAAAVSICFAHMLTFHGATLRDYMAPRFMLPLCAYAAHAPI